MTTQEQIQVRVSRRLLLVLFAVGALFALVGLEVLVLRAVFNMIPEGVAIQLFGIGAVAIGALLVVSQARYLLRPPVMLHADREHIAFGTGFGYQPYSIPLRHLQAVDVFRTYSNLEVGGQRRTVEGGVELRFAPNGEIPAGMATSAGISYQNHCLRLFKTYMNRPPGEVVETVRRLRGRR